MKNAYGIWHRLFGLLVIVFVILADQLSKWAITEKLLRPMGEHSSFGFFSWLSQAPERLPPARVELMPFFNIVMVWNEGVSFGLFNNLAVPIPVLLSGFSLLLSAAFIIWMLRTTSCATALALALIVGGALGNVIDRLRFGAVIDFLDFYIGNWHWPAFNLADSCIVLGVLGLIVYSLFFEKRPS
ncbi:MAG: signal peptidase II [Alphaproteobacteria bacterium]|nr:signal peptidase II [Alphaproteobacteria bacterium]